MKRLFLFLVMTNIVFGLFAQTDFFYSYTGSKEQFKIRKDKILVITKSISDTKKIMEQTSVFRSAYNLNDERIIVTIDTLDTNMEKLKQSFDIVDTSYFLEYSDGTLQVPTNKIFVKAKKGLTIKQIIDLTKLTKIVEAIELVNPEHEIYLITLNVKTGEILPLTRIIYETGSVEVAEPSFLRELELHVPTDNPNYGSQWGLRNIGQNGGIAGIDIRAEGAWSITHGNNNIRIAVLDEGVDITHPDLQANLLPGIDATVFPLAGNGSATGDEAHGTACAGVIAAVDNTIGSIGVAYGCRIIPIRVGHRHIVNGQTLWTEDIWLSRGIRRAWEIDQADVLSNSWGGGAPNANITAEINNAITQGRNSRGCVVVFSTGNSNRAVGYPATLSNVIAVGAISQCGTRKRSSNNPNLLNPGVLPDPAGVSCDGETWWGSNFGNELDVVAPGVNIFTTDIQGTAGYNISNGTAGNYFPTFGGTSAACPHVSGIAALILSVNPTLTVQQVRNIIEGTTQKIGGYNYAITAGRPNGIWHQEMGYGLVDAYAAVRAACPITNFTTPPTVTTNTTITGCDISVQDVTVQNNAKLTLDATNTTTINGAFEVILGSELEIK